MTHNRVQIVSLSHHQCILEEMHQLRNTGHLCDITVQVDHQGNMSEFEAHQVVLAAASGYFKSILLAEEPVKKALLCDVPASAFEAFLQYVYTGEVEVERAVIHNIFKMAELLECVDLLDACKAVSGLAVANDTERPDPQGLAETNETFQPPSPSPPMRRVRKTKAGQKRKAQSREAKTTKVCSDSPNSEEKKPQKKRKNKDATDALKDVEETDKDEGKDKEPKMKRRSVGLASRTQPLGVRAKKRPGRGRAKASVVASDTPQEENPTSEVAATPQSIEQSDSGLDKSHTPITHCDNESTPSLTPPRPRSPSFSTSSSSSSSSDSGAEDTVPKSKVRSSRVSFRCDKCDKSFLYMKVYVKHMQQSHGEQPQVEFRCSTCQQTFANRCNLKFHELHVHSDMRLYPCDICGKAFKRRKDVRRHRKQVHEGGYERHHCPDCGKALSSRSALKLHERTHTGYKPFECLECGAKFAQSSALRTHQRLHTGEKPFACDQCDARFTQNHMLAYHKRVHTGERPFMCEICGKNFASKEYLKHHSRLHSGHKPYKCEVCARPFAQRNSLHQHMKTHTGDRPYHCTDCDKKFTQLNALQRHQRIHRGEKPFQCTLCNRTFTDKSTLRRHAMTHDKNTPWRNFLKVLKDNVEEKPVKTPRPPPVKKEKKEKSTKTPASPSETPRTRARAKGVRTQAEAQATVSAESVALPADWASHGTITLVSPASLSGFTVIQTEVSAGTQLVTADGAVAVPLSLPISVTHTDASGTTTTSTSTALPLPVSDAILAPGHKQFQVMSPTLEAAMVAGEIQCVTVGETEHTGSDSVPHVAETCVYTE